MSKTATNKSIEEIAEEIKKKYGDHVLVRGSETRQDTPHTSTGILAYDLALGGGWATNQWNEIVGEESSGKTAIAYKTIAANQAKDPNYLAMWVAAEEYVPEYASSVGVDLDRLWVLESNEMETVLEFVLTAIENHSVDCVVIDSIPALVPDREVEKKMDEAIVGVGALTLGKFFRKCALAQRRSVGERDCTLIAINQWREKIGVMYGDPRTTPGGKAKNYFYFTRVEVRRDEWLSEGSAIEKRVGQSIKMRVMKNKTYRPQQVAVADFYFSDTGNFKKGDFDAAKDIVNVCLALDLFEGRYKLDGERIAGSKEELYDVVRGNPELQGILIERALGGLQ